MRPPAFYSAGFSPCNGYFSVPDFLLIGSPLRSLCGGDLTASVKWQARYKPKSKLWDRASAKQAGVPTPLFIVSSDQLKSTTKMQLNLRKSLIISVPQPWECSSCLWQRFICTVMVSGAAAEHTRPRLWFLWLSELASPIRAGRRWQSWCNTHLAGSSLWLPSALCPGVYLLALCLHVTPFPGHSRLFLRKVMVLLPKHKHYTSPWIAWSTAGCLWATVLAKMLAI